MNIVTTDRIIEGVTGCTTFWKCPEYARWAKLKARWISDGLPIEFLPQEPTKQNTLAFVLRDRFQKRRGIVRSVDTKVPGEVSWAILPADIDPDGRPMFKTAWTCTMDSKGDLSFTDCPFHLQQEVEDLMDSFAGAMTRNDLSVWCSKLMRHLDATNLKPSGGVYFVPAPQMPLYQKVREAARAGAGVNLLQIPAMVAEDTAAAVMEALADEANDEAEAYVEAIREAQGKGKEHGKSLNARQEKAAAMIAKLKRYEAVFGTQLDNLREKLVKLSGPAMLVDLADI